MAMFTICTAIIPEGELEKHIRGFREAEKRFTREIGVLQRDFYQCVQQPHIIWSNTEWTSEKAHNDAAASIMKVRKDDRIGSAYFEPGLYFEIFCNEIEEVSYEAPDRQAAGLIVVSHGLVALKQLENWDETVRSTSKDLPSSKRPRFSRVFYNYYNSAEFVGFMGWNSLKDYQEHRMIDDLTIEERVYTGLKRGSSLLAAYNQFQCIPLKVK